MQTIIASYGIE